MIRFNWNQDKNIALKKERDISFEEIVFVIENDGLLDDVKHHSRENQRLFVVYTKSYVYLIPYVNESDGSVFLKTIIPSKKAYKKYLGAIK
jgi:uncharacterized DUF497 family protein